MAQTETRSAPLGLRIRPSLKTTLEKLARDDKRTLASYVELVLEEHVWSMATGRIDNRADKKKSRKRK